MKRIAILGSTGSIGEQTLDVVAAHPESFEVGALAAGRRTEVLAEQVRRFRPALVSMGDAEAAAELRRRLGDHPVEILHGARGSWTWSGVSSAARGLGSIETLSGTICRR